MKKIAYIDITKLKSHEQISRKKLLIVINDLMDKGYIKNPVVVDRKTLIILDGHHRVAALRKLGVKKAPVYLVDYMNREIKVYLRRKELLMEMIKTMVIKTALDSKTFPRKTTRHFIKNRPRNINCKLNQLF